MALELTGAAAVRLRVPSRCAQAWLLFALLSVLLLRQIADPDIWFYLVLGREIAASHALPAQEFYLFPALGEPAMFSAVGFSLLHYAAHHFAGYAGMAAVNAFLGAGALALLVSAARPDDDSRWHWPVLLCVLALVYACLNFRLVYRPESTLYLAVAAEILLLERWLADGRMLRLGYLPLLSWGIAQLHTTAVVLLLIYGAYACHWGVRALRRRVAFAATTALRLVLVGAAMALLPVLNPNGVEQALLLLRTYGGEWNGLIEYLPVWETPALRPFAALALIAVWACWRAPERRLVDVLLLAGFGFLAVKHVRNVGLFALVALLPVARTLMYHLANDTAGLAVAARRALAAGLAALGAAGMLWVTWRVGGWGVGVHGGFPVHAVDLVRRIAPGGNVMNIYHLGGYLAWALGPGYRVALDGHFVRPTPARAYHDGIMRCDADWEDALRRHSVGFIVTPATTPYFGAMIPLVECLAENKRWRLLSVEPGGMLFAADRVGAELPALDKREIWRQVEREAGATLAEAPERQDARKSLALAARRLSAP